MGKYYYVPDPGEQYSQPVPDRLMQLRKNQMQQPQMQVQQMAMALSETSRPVSSREEAMGVPADFNGTLMVFPDVTHNRVYTKRWNYNTGAADFDEYVHVNTIAEPEKEKNQEKSAEAPAYATVDYVKNLEERIATLENRKCSCEKKASIMRSSSKKEETKDDE